MSKSTDRFSRIQQRLSNSLTEIDYTTYVEQLNSQRLKHPTTPKVYYPFNLSTNFTSVPPNLEFSISEVLSNRYSYTGVVLSRELLYSLNDSVLSNIPNKQTIYYYEFISLLTSANDSMANWKYIYIPLILLDFVKTKLPTVKTWSKNGLRLTYPEASHLVKLKELNASDNIPIIKHTTQDTSHPFLPGFYFSNSSFVLREGNTFYEYFDSTGYYGIKDALYFSNLRPNLVTFPLGQVFEGDLIQTPDRKFYMGDYPEYGEEPWYGSFLGYKTTTQYSVNFTFYLYEQPNTQKTFLSLAPPSKQAKAILAPYLTT